MATFTEVLERSSITCPDPALAELEVPVLCGPQRQGDIMIIPRSAAGAAELAGFVRVPVEGWRVVRGEATGNTHMVHADVDGLVFYSPADGGDGVFLGVLHVPAGSVAWLIHTDEHGVNGVGAGTYTLHGKREQAEEIRRVQD